ncbi:MAG: NTP transferase domain-containing protein [Proteobacteria bacterium]|nr:NTP transferase domain-containing protein [Pseudomonadota bacterium]MBI3499331.1 NTP transferase domain-containing protein [Pseudomonadota bacterium]
MKFGEIALDDARGTILAHGIKLTGRAYKKGRVLSADDVAQLRAAGFERVVAAQLEPGDVPEDTAANALAEAAAGEHLTAQPAFTGRANLFATSVGLVSFDSKRLDQLNLVDESVTMATLPHLDVVEPGQMVATIKIIPFAVRAEVLATCVAIASQRGPLLSLKPLRAAKVGLVQTVLPGTKESVLDGTVESTRARLTRLGSELVREIRCGHTEREVANAIQTLKAQGVDLILLFGASAVVDRRDVIPAALVRSGGVVTHFGMPVDPGNLLLLGHAGNVPAIGMPGCARSPKFNGFDWVLQRQLAGVPVSAREVMGMGAGGLLKEIPSRPLPRAGKAVNEAAPLPEPAPKASGRAPRIAALVLAGGQSRRMGATNKLLAQIEGLPMVARVVDAAKAAKAAEVVVVTGHQADEVRAVLAERSVRFVHNPDYAVGLSTSLKAGLAALSADVDGALVCLGDMPRVTPAMIDRLIQAFDPIEGRAICVPTANGKRGNPVLWAKRFFPEMARVEGDVGARHLIGEHAEVVAEVEMGDDAVLIDIDTPQALTALGKTAKVRA